MNLPEYSFASTKEKNRIFQRNPSFTRKEETVIPKKSVKNSFFAKAMSFVEEKDFPAKM